MSAKVVDASAVLAVLLDEPQAAEIEARIEGDELFAPLLIVFEVVNLCARKARQFPEKRQEFCEALLEFRRLEVHLKEADPEEVFELAIRHKLTGYDASYLWLSQQMDAELVTLDEELIAAAVRHPSL